MGSNPLSAFGGPVKVTEMGGEGGSSMLTDDFRCCLLRAESRVWHTGSTPDPTPDLCLAPLHGAPRRGPWSGSELLVPAIAPWPRAVLLSTWQSAGGSVSQTIIRKRVDKPQRAHS